jgi:hypothetical protein
MAQLLISRQSSYKKRGGSMNHDKKYLVWSLGYVVIGMAIGVYMGASHNHQQLVAHAHILLVGFVVSFIYSLIHKLWLNQPSRLIANIQFVLHQVASITMFSALLLLYGGVFPESTLGPILGISSIGVLISALLMIYLVVKFSTPSTQRA